MAHGAPLRQRHVQRQVLRSVPVPDVVMSRQIHWQHWDILTQVLGLQMSALRVCLKAVRVIIVRDVVLSQV